MAYDSLIPFDESTDVIAPVVKARRPRPRPAKKVLRPESSQPLQMETPKEPFEVPLLTRDLPEVRPLRWDWLLLLVPLLFILFRLASQ